MPQILESERAAKPVRQRTRAGADPALSISIARSPIDVQEAWNLVYHAYRDAELIDDNPFRIHTVTQALRPGNSVIIGKVNGVIVSTLTIMHDGRDGLPLDRVYATELDELRSQGRRLMEVGLFADRRLSIGRASAAFREMMRFVFYSSCYTLSDIMIGVHPSHAAFYERNFGFHIAGPRSVHPTVRNRPVILLRGDTQAQLSGDTVPRQLVEYVKNHLPRATFDQRAAMRPDSFAGTVIEAFMNGLAGLWNNMAMAPRITGTTTA